MYNSNYDIGFQEGKERAKELYIDNFMKTPDRKTYKNIESYNYATGYVNGWNAVIEMRFEQEEDKM